MIKLNLCLSDIDKSRIRKAKNGKLYIDVLAKKKNSTDQYGNDWMVVEDLTKDERNAGRQGKILGNGKTIGSVGGNQSSQPSQSSNISADDLPY